MKKMQAFAVVAAVASTLAMSSAVAVAGQLQILVHTGSSAVSQTGVTWNNITTASSNVPLYYSDGTLSGLTYDDLTGYSSIVNDTRYNTRSTLMNHPLSWVNSLDTAGLTAFATNFSQNAFNPPTFTDLNMHGFSGLTGRDVTVQAVATYLGNGLSDLRYGNYTVNGQYTTLDGGTAPTYKPSSNFQDGTDNLNYMLWDKLPWGSGAYSGDAMQVSFERSNNTVVLNGFRLSYKLPGIVADFAGGAGNTSADQFGGKAGDGWTGGWNKSGSTVTGTVTNANPLNGGGNYLSITNIDNTGGGYTRQFTSFDGVDPTHEAYSVQADFRIDSMDVNDYQLGVRANNGVNTSSDVIGNIKAESSIWHVINGNGSGGAIDLSTGLAVVSGDVYHVRFDIDPTTLTYVLTLMDLTANTSYTSGTLNTRNVNAVAMPYFFIGRQYNTNNASDGAISVDAILVSVPSPAALPAGVALLGLLTIRRRRN